MTSRERRSRRRNGLLVGLLTIAGAISAPAIRADDVSGAQARGAEEYLAAVAGGGAQAVALAFHPAELEALRTRLLTRLRADTAKNDSTSRTRLFGAGMSLAELERMTGASFYAELAKRLELRSRVFEDVKWLGAIREGDAVHVVGRGKPPRERGEVPVLTAVTLLPYGKEWRAAIPSEINAQIDDLLAGRTSGRGSASSQPASTAPPAAVAAPSTDPAINTLLAAAEKSLIDNQCADYYQQHLSPNFRRATSSAALKTLIASCERSVGTRETLIAALRIVRDLTPRMEFDGARAVYDVSGQGLPFDRYVLERIDKRWYIAE